MSTPHSFEFPAPDDIETGLPRSRSRIRAHLFMPPRGEDAAMHSLPLIVLIAG